MTQDALAQKNAQRKALVKSLAALLRTAHSALIQSLKKARETHQGRELTPLEWFQQLSAEPQYRWMHALTALMSDIDALQDNRTEIDQNDFAIVCHAVSDLFGTESNEFRNRYFDALAADPSLIPSHATLKRVIDQLPKTAIEGHAAEIRRAWHISERRLAHMRASKTPGGSSSDPSSDSSSGSLS